MASIKVRRFKEGLGSTGTLLECLRYAGLISTVETEFVEKGERVITYHSFTIYAPKGVHEAKWAEMNQSRMSSFNVKAEVID